MINRVPHFTILFFLLYISCLAQSQHSNFVIKEPLFNEVSLLRNIKTLSSDSFEGRRTGTRGAVKAKKYIINEFNALNVKPLGRNFEQPFSFLSKGKSYQGVNVLGLVKGSCCTDSYIVISAHYDHEGIKRGKIYNGADDDASGVSALFGIAEYFKNHPPKHSVILAAFDGEELGLKGSKYFVDNSIVPRKQIMLNLNLDMISRSDKNELFAVGTRYSKTLEQIILKGGYSNKIKLLTGHDGSNWKDDWTDASDHESFHKKGIPFIYFGVEDHKDYHQPTDDFENIQPEFYIEAVNIIISVFNKVDALQIKR